MRMALCLLGIFAVGGFVCWLPSIVVHLWRGDTFSAKDVLVLTLVMPAVATTAAIAGQRFVKLRMAGAFVSLAVCGGMWLLGPLAMFISATPTGGGFAMPDPWASLLIMTAIFPLTTFSMSLYDGSIGGLLLSTLTLLVLFGVDLVRIVLAAPAKRNPLD